MDGTLKLWDCATSQELATLPGHLDETTDVAFSPDGRTLASISQNGNPSSFGTSPRAGNWCHWIFHRPAAYVVFSPDGTRLAVTTEAGKIHFFEGPLTPQILETNR
jgi:WD40 repeat protein